MSAGFLLLLLLTLIPCPFLVHSFIKHPLKYSKLVDAIFRPKSAGTPHKPRIRARR
jgi:hypothetical protein